MTTISGLPAHILLVHAVVVLIPLSAILVVVIAISSRARRRLDILTVILALVALISVPLTTEAGEWLEHRLPRTALLRTHTELGDSMLPWAVALALVTILVVVIYRRRDRHTNDSRPSGVPESEEKGRHSGTGRLTTTVLATLAILVAAGSIVTVYRIGDSGARAAWTGNFSAQPLPRPAGQLPPSK
jgi:formate hydrogenlyase subunit 3/multisubunit Na+/H+ antiporter MnhD subunit